MYAACACTPQVSLSAIPATKIEPVDAGGNPAALGGSEGRTTPDGYVVNTSYTTQYPRLENFATTNKIVPPLNNPTLGDRLSDANIPWKFYAGGLDNALAGNADPTFQPHHQSYLYFAKYGPGTPGATHIVDDSNFLEGLECRRAARRFVDQAARRKQRTSRYANIATGQMFVANLVSQIQMSKAWKYTLIVIVYDEAGGHYDHVSPTPTDRFGPSTRVPAIFISPFARRGFIDHTNYSVADRDLGATPLSLAAFDFTQATPAAFARTSLGDVPRVPLPPRYTGHSMTEMDYDQ